MPDWSELIPSMVRGAIVGGATPNIAEGGPTDIFRAMEASMMDADQLRRRKYEQAIQQTEIERQKKLAEAQRLFREMQLKHAGTDMATQEARLSTARQQLQHNIEQAESKAKTDRIGAEAAFAKENTEQAEAAENRRIAAEDRDLKTPAGRLAQWRTLQQANPDVELPVNVPYIATGKYEAPKEEGTISNAYELAMEAAGGDARLAVQIVKEILGRDKPAKGELDDAAQTEASEIIVGAEGDYDKAIEHAKLTGKGAALKVLLDWRVLEKRGDPTSRSGQMGTAEIQALISGGEAPAQGPPPMMSTGADLGVPGGVPGMGAPGVPYNIPNLPNPDPLAFYGQ